MLALTLSLSFVIAFSCVGLSFIQSVQDVAYMDEVFHIPQVQLFCAYNFTYWDPMITTLPGLYLSSLLFLYPFANLQGVNLLEVCTVRNLRACNIVFCVGNFLLLFVISRKLNENFQDKKSRVRHGLNALVLTLFPVLYFFTWLYYTDPGATFFTLLMYSLCIHGYYEWSALAGFAAVLFRQTNIVWVIFCISLAKSEVIERELCVEKKIRGNLNNLKDFDVLKLIVKDVFSSPSRFFYLAKRIILKTFCYLCILAEFCVFVYINKGLVVGDRSHHQASFNFPQVFYFLMISAGFSFIYMIQLKHIANFLLAVKNHPIRVLLFLVLAGFLIMTFTYEHKYLLSDNRHYPFYLWSKCYKRFPLARYALIGVYMYSLYRFYILTIHKGFMWRVSFAICVIACLVPQTLLEFRYYIIPFYVLRLNMKLPCMKALMIELLFYLAINAFTVYVFMFRPIIWADNPHPQRFMW